MLIFKLLILFCTFATIGYLYYQKNELGTRRTLVMGVLLILLGLIHTMIWDVGYMLLGMGLVAVAGALLVFGNGLGKLLYFAGIMLIAIMSAKEFGMTRPFFSQVGMLSVIAIFVMFLEENEPSSNKNHIQQYHAMSAVQREKERQYRTTLQQKYDDPRLVEKEKTRVGKIYLIILSSIIATMFLLLMF